MQPNAEMSYCHVGFDLKAARQICDQATFQLTGEDIDEDLKILIDQANMLPAALDEIGRLRKALALKTEQHKGQAHVIGSYLGMLADFNELNESQTKRIAELEESNKYLSDRWAGQIATMKAICTKERFWQIWKAGECQTVERATQKAKDQLAKEYPEINWEE